MKINNLRNKVALANHGGAMEADTISKNGRSSKSHKSRGNFSRKTSFALLAAGIMICGLLFTSCTGGNSPSSVVKKAMNALMKKDYEEYYTYFYNVNLSAEQKASLREKSKETSESDLIKFEIQDERIFDNGEKATVLVKVFSKNGREDTVEMPLIKTSSGWKISQH